MKKTALLGIAAIGALGFTACNSGDCQNGACKSDGDKVELYTGVVPAADVDGTVYTLKLEFDDDNNYTDGDYTLVENSIAIDTTAVQGFREVATSFSKGDFKKDTKQVGGANVDYIVLTPDANDALGTPSGSSAYFVINADGTLTMVGADLQLPANAELYTLSAQK